MRTFLLSIACLTSLAATGCSTGPGECDDSVFCLNPLTDDPLCQEFCAEQVCDGVDDVEFAQCGNPFAGSTECVCECVSGGGTCEPGDMGGTGGEDGSGDQTTIRTGGTCDANDPEMEFICSELCFEICQPEEVAQSDECTPEGICSCTCVNYDA